MPIDKALNQAPTLEIVTGIPEPEIDIEIQIDEDGGATVEIGEGACRLFAGGAEIVVGDPWMFRIGGDGPGSARRRKKILARRDPAGAAVGGEIRRRFCGRHGHARKNSAHACEDRQCGNTSFHDDPLPNVRCGED